MDEGSADLYAGRAICREIVRDGRRAQQRVCLRRIFGNAYRRRRTMPPTGKSTNTDYDYVMEFVGDKIAT
jgi:hypothetical protein